MQQTSLPVSQQRTMQLVSKYGDRDSFLKTYNPDYQQQICTNVDVCFFGDFPTLATIRAGYGNNVPVIWLIFQLHNLSEYCGCKDKLQGKMLEECARVIANEFYYLKISEIMLFLYRFKSGKYGRFYGSVDPLVITTSLREFLKERAYFHNRHKEETEFRKQKEERKTSETWEDYCMRVYGRIRKHPYSKE